MEDADLFSLMMMFLLATMSVFVFSNAEGTRVNRASIFALVISIFGIIYYSYRIVIVE